MRRNFRIERSVKLRATPLLRGAESMQNIELDQRRWYEKPIAEKVYSVVR
jgi:hypothetical protein